VHLPDQTAPLKLICPRCNHANPLVSWSCLNCTETLPQTLEPPTQSDTLNAPKDDMGFQWWTIWAWLGLTIGNLYLLGALHEIVGLALVLVAINSVLAVLVLRFNKYAFLMATIMSINPILWIINGIYLKNRWNHPKVN
jgi:hypothetical protein